MSNNIIFNKKLEEYNKKYRNGRYKLLKYTKKEVEQYDKIANQTLKSKNYLLRGRKWALIGDTYYEIPKAPRTLWFRNVNAGVKAATCALLGGAVAGGAGYGIYVAVANKSPVVKPFSKEDVELDEETSKVVTVKEAKKDDKGNEIVVLEAKEDDKYVESVEVKIGGDTLTQGEEASGGQCSFDETTGILTVYEKTAKEKEGKVNVTATVDNMLPITSINIENDEKTHQVEVGKQLHFKATCSPTYPKQKVTWSIQEQEETSNTIDEKTGVFVAKEAGSINVIAAAGDESRIKSEPFKVTVEGQQETVKITNAPTTKIYVGYNGQLKAETTPSKLTLTWSSSNNDAVKIDPESGQFLAVGPGKATITVTTPTGANDKCDITVETSPTTSYHVELNSNVKEGETIVLEGAGEYDSGSNVHIWACGNDNYKFAGWYLDSEYKTPYEKTDPEFILENLQSNLILYAKFVSGKETTCEIVIDKVDEKAGKVTGKGKHVKEGKVIVTAEANEGYNFDGWFADEEFKEELSEENEYEIDSSEIGDEPLNIFAKFEKEGSKTYVSIEKKGEASDLGSVTGDGEYDVGTEVELTASVTSPGKFAGWYDNESCSGEPLSTDTTYKYTVPQTERGDVTLYAKFDYDYPYLTFTRVGDTNTCTVKANTTGTMPDDLLIPLKSPDGCYVTGIETDGFKDQTGIKTVIIPAQCNVINIGAFSGCTSLTGITFNQPGGGWRISDEPAGVLSIDSLSDSEKALELYKSHSNVKWYKSSNDLNWSDFKIPEDEAHGFDGTQTLYEISQSAKTITFSTDESVDGALCGVLSNSNIYANNDTTSKTLSIWSEKPIAISKHDMFNNCYYLETINLNNVDSTELTSCYGMFDSCQNLKSIDFGTLDTSRVNTFHNMFASCSSLASIDLTKLKTSNVTDMAYMFTGCNSLTDITFGTNFNTSKVEFMNSMFYNCSEYKNVNLTCFDTSSLKECNRMFGNFTSNTNKIETIDLSSFVSTSLTDCSGMFIKCCNLKTIYASDSFAINTSTMDTDSMFKENLNLVGGDGFTVGGTTYDGSVAKINKHKTDTAGTVEGLFTEKHTFNFKDTTSGDYVGHKALTITPSNTYTFNATVSANNYPTKLKLLVNDTEIDYSSLIDGEIKVYLDGIELSNATISEGQINLPSITFAGYLKIVFTTKSDATTQNAVNAVLAIS